MAVGGTVARKRLLVRLPLLTADASGAVGNTDRESLPEVRSDPEESVDFSSVFELAPLSDGALSVMLFRLLPIFIEFPLNFCWRKPALCCTAYMPSLRVFVSTTCGKFFVARSMLRFCTLGQHVDKCLSQD